MKNLNNDMWFVYIDGYRIVQTRSIGYKWVYYKTTYSRYKRISRTKWDKACISTLAEHQYKINIKNQAHKLGISMTKPSRILRSHPTRRFGWEYKSFEELEAEVLEHQREVA